MNNGKIWFLALVAAMGGFLFGYDTAVINGAEQQIQSFFGLTPTMHGLVMSSCLWGTVIGALFGGRITDWLGRKKTLLFVGMFYLLSAVWSPLAGDYVSLLVARFIGGLAVGCSSIAAPVYIAEISPAEKRGMLTAIFQFDVVLGVCISQLVNLIIGNACAGGPNEWRIMLGAEAVPAFLFTVLCPFIIESPRWLEMKAAGPLPAKDRTPKKRLFQKAYLMPLMIAFLVAFFNQLSGINAVNYFMKRIYMMAGMTDSSALSLAAMTQVFNAIATFTGMALIDRLGRKALLIIGGTGYVISLTCCALAFHFGAGMLATICVIVFIISHAIGQGTVIWVIIAEIFPTSVRAQGQSFGSFTHWSFAAIITFVFPIAAAKFAPEKIFGFFAIFMVLHLLWAIFIVPETKGKELED